MMVKYTDGLSKVEGYSRLKHFPFFLTDGYKPLEAPNLWLINVAISVTNSEETVKQYSSHLSRFLKWLDKTGFGAEKWANITLEKIYAYAEWLLHDDDEKKVPSEPVVEGYIATIANFYRWAASAGYRVAWDADTETIAIIIKDAFLTGNAHLEIKRRVLKLTKNSNNAIINRKFKFLTNELFAELYSMFDDPMLQAQYYLMRQTGLRAKEVQQIPLKGRGKNVSLRFYDTRCEEVPEYVFFSYGGKGKNYEIPIDGRVWARVCAICAPLFFERSAEYEKKNPGKFLSQGRLFVNKYGRPYTYKMLIDGFKRVKARSDFPKSLKKFAPHMLRTAFASYYVHDAYKAAGDKLTEVFHAKIGSELQALLGHEDVNTTWNTYVRYAIEISNPNVTSDTIDTLLFGKTKEDSLYDSVSSIVSAVEILSREPDKKETTALPPLYR